MGRRRTQSYIFWTPEKVVEAKTLYESGRTYNELAAHFNVTRNAVASILRRAGAVEPLPDHELFRRQQGAGSYFKRSSDYHLGPAGCQWIAGEPSENDRCKCGKPREKRRPYCEEHWKRAWRKSAAEQGVFYDGANSLDFRRKIGGRG